jgi:hypothetical protein
MVPWSGGRSLCADTACSSALSVGRSTPVVVQHEKCLLSAFCSVGDWSHQVPILHPASPSLAQPRPMRLICSLTNVAKLTSDLVLVHFLSTNLSISCQSDCCCLFSYFGLFSDRLCDLVVRPPGYRSRGPKFDSSSYNIS